MEKKNKFLFLSVKASVFIMLRLFHRRTEYSQANGIFRAGAEYSVRVRNIPCGCRIFRAGAKYSVQPLAVSALPLELFCRAPSIFHIALNLIPIVSGDSKPLRRDWSQQEKKFKHFGLIWLKKPPHILPIVMVNITYRYKFQIMGQLRPFYM